MFVNRFIKTLHDDVTALRKGSVNPDGSSPFIYKHKDPDNPWLKIAENKISAAEFFYGGLVGHGTCQFFDFGTITNDQIKEESLTVAQAYEVGLIDLPAELCWFEHRWDDGQSGTISSGYFYMKTPHGILGTEVRLITQRNLKKAFRDATPTQDHPEFFIWDGVAVRLPIKASPKGYNCGVAVNTTGGAVNPSNVFDPLMSMLGRLNADGIDKVHIPAPAKLNRRREARGLLGAVAYTEVKIRPYRAPMGHSGPFQGDRAVVRFHFRRGHVRHFQNGDVTWVRPCFVGNPEDGVIKHTYIVDDRHV